MNRVSSSLRSLCADFDIIVHRVRPTPCPGDGLSQICSPRTTHSRGKTNAKLHVLAGRSNDEERTCMSETFFR